LDHIWNVILVAWSIEDGELLSWRVELSSTDFDGLSLLFLLLRVVHDVGEPPGITILLLGFGLELGDFSLVNNTHLVDDLTRNG